MPQLQRCPPNDFQEVFLTGATGFVGRFFLRELLRQNERLIVHCLVRAESAEHGLERIHDALECAEVWEEEFAPRLRVVPGDAYEERFGLGEPAFDELCRRIDAVYHLAANVGLVLSYADIREENTLGLRSVLELCLRTRLKHLFYGSTMGVFPAYFCDFGGEHSRSRIDDQMQPDLADMKMTFPLGAIGYPWSKLVAERGVLFAQAAGVPVAIFRLPQMGLSSTGYTQANDLPARLFAAATQLGKAPHGFSIQRNAEPVDTVSEICTAISLNPNRRFTIYHCCDPEPPYEDLEVADLGYYWQSVPLRILQAFVPGPRRGVSVARPVGADRPFRALLVQRGQGPAHGDGLRPRHSGGLPPPDQVAGTADTPCAFLRLGQASSGGMALSNSAGPPGLRRSHRSGRALRPTNGRALRANLPFVDARRPPATRGGAEIAGGRTAGHAAQPHHLRTDPAHSAAMRRSPANGGSTPRSNGSGSHGRSSSSASTAPARLFCIACCRAIRASGHCGATS